MKKIRKILPLSIYDIPGIERWLEEQASNGLFPTFIDAWVTFTPNAVAGTRFRLEPYGKIGTEPTEEQLMIYREAGWEYAFAVGKVYFLFYTTNPEAVELYSDHESRGLSIERLEQRVHKYQRTRRVIYSLLAVALVWALFFHQSKYDVQPDRFARMPLLLLELCSPILLIFLIIAAFSWWRNRRDIRILSETCRALKEGFSPPASPGPSKGIIWEQKIALALIPVLLILTVISYMGTHGNMAKPLDSFSLPYVVLQELEQEEVVAYQTLFGFDEHYEEENLAEHHLSLLAPVWYEVLQEGYATAAGDYRGFSTYPEADDRFELRYTPNLDAVYFQLLIPALARPVAEAQLDAYRLVNLMWSYEEVDVPDLDFVILADEPDGIWQMIAMGKGNQVAVFRYGGREDLSEHLDLLATAVK